jgi:hypothetical protein
VEEVIGSGRGRQALSLSVDDLFALNRFLPTAGELFHYFEVRQQVAAIRKAMLLEELNYPRLVEEAKKEAKRATAIPPKKR